VNSSWFCKDNDDDHHLWLGLPVLQHLVASGQWPEIGPSIALQHHPREVLAPEEQHAYAPRPNTSDYVSKRVDVLLTGHTHGEIRSPDRLAGRALNFTAGATYASADYVNSFRVMRIFPDHLEHRGFEFDPRRVEWRVMGSAQSEGFAGSKVAKSIAISVASSDAFLRWRSRATEDAKSVLETKSRAVKSAGKLPRLTPMRVSLRETTLEQQEGKTRGSRLPRINLLSPYEAVRRSPDHKTLLLGDFGSGKSTALALFVTETIEKSDKMLSVFVPAAQLRLKGKFTLKELISAVSEYFNAQVAPSEPAIDLLKVLNEGVEIALAVDALDEVSGHEGTYLVHQLAKATEQWSNLQIIATARPVEIIGIDYSTWQVLNVLPVSDADRRSMIQEELIAEDVPTTKAQDIAQELNDRVVRFPSIVPMLTTPLSVRLFFPRLNSGAFGAEFTTGDLVVETIEERLGKWSARDLKEPIVAAFENQFVTPHSRTNLLGTVLMQLAQPAEVTRATLMETLEGVLAQRDIRNPPKIANEALGYYERAGLFSFFRVGRESDLTFDRAGALVVGCDLQVEAAQSTVEAVRAAADLNVLSALFDKAEAYAEAKRIKPWCCSMNRRKP
jgi:hypothetical protein